MIGGGSIARRYARAMLDIGQEEHNLRRSLTELERFDALLTATPFLKEILSAREVNRRDKRGAVETALSRDGFLPTTKSFLLLLVDKDRMDILSPILSELRRMMEALEGIERVEVVAPMPMTVTQKELLKVTLERQTGKKVELEEKVDPAVLGGIVVKVGSTVYDGSLHTQIQKIRENLQKG